jgi:hypothetical protein
MRNAGVGWPLCGACYERAGVGGRRDLGQHLADRLHRAHRPQHRCCQVRTWAGFYTGCRAGHIERATQADAAARCRGWILLQSLRTQLQAQNIQQSTQMDVLNGAPPALLRLPCACMDGHLHIAAQVHFDRRLWRVGRMLNELEPRSLDS